MKKEYPNYRGYIIEKADWACTHKWEAYPDDAPCDYEPIYERTLRELKESIDEDIAGERV